jgi:hypothetical protein
MTIVPIGSLIADDPEALAADPTTYRGILDPLTRDEEVALALRQKQEAEVEAKETAHAEALANRKAELHRRLDEIDATLDAALEDQYGEHFVPITDVMKADYARFQAFGKEEGLPTGIPNLAEPDDFRALAIAIAKFLALQDTEWSEIVRLHDSLSAYMSNVFGTDPCNNIRVKTVMGLVYKAKERKEANGNL